LPWQPPEAHQMGAAQPSIKEMDDAGTLLMMCARGTERAPFPPVSGAPALSSNARSLSEPHTSVFAATPEDMAEQESTAESTADEPDGPTRSAEASQLARHQSDAAGMPSSGAHGPCSSQHGSGRSISSRSASTDSSGGGLFDSRYVLSKFHSLTRHLASKRSKCEEHPRKRLAAGTESGAPPSATPSSVTNSGELRWSIISKMGQLLDSGDEKAMEKLEESLETVNKALE